MASDGKVKIDVELETDGVKSDAEKVEDILNGIGKADHRIRFGVDDKSAREKIQQIANDVRHLPKEARTELRAIGNKAGIEEFDKFLKLLPKEERVKLLTDFQDKGIVDFKHALSQIPKEKRSKVELNDNASEPLKNIKKGIDEIPEEHDTKINVDDSGAEQRLSSFSRAQNDASGNSKTLLSSVKSVAAGLGIYQVAAKAATAVSDQFSGAVSRFDTLNNFPKVMESMGASAKDSNAAIKTLSNGIQGLPTSLDQVAKSTQVFMPFSDNANEAAKATLALNDAFLASNASTADASRGLEQYKQMLANGKVDMMGWRSVEETMPASLQKVAKSFGIASGSTQDLYNKLDSGEISMKQLNQRFIELDGGANGFHKTALNATDGIGTAFENLGNRTKIALESVIRGFDNMVKSLTGSSIGANINKISSHFSEFGKAGEQVFEGLGKWLKPLTPAFQTLGGIVKTVFDGMLTPVKDAKNALQDLLKPLASLKNSSSFAKPLNNALKEIGSHERALKAIGAAIASIVAGLVASKVAIDTVNKVRNAVSKLSKTFSTLSKLASANPYAIAITAIVALGIAFVTAYKHSKTFRDGVNNVVKTLKNFLMPIIDRIVKALQNFGKRISPIISQISKAFAQLAKAAKPYVNDIIKTFDKLKPYFQILLASLKAIIGAGLKIIETIVKAAWDIIKNSTKTVWENIKVIVETTLKVIRDVIKTVTALIKGDWSGVWNGIKSIFSDVWDGILGIGKNVFGNLKNTIGDILGDIKSVWEKQWNGMAKFFSGIWDGIKSAAKTGLNGVIEFLNGGINGINSVIHFFGGKEKTISPIKKLAAGISANDADELALVNDEGGDTYREAIVRTNGQVEIPKERNQLVYLNRGDEVIPARKTAEIFGLNRYENGKEGWLSAAWNNVKNWAGDTFEAIEDALKDPLGVLTKLFHKGKNSATAVWKTIGDDAADYLPKAGVDWFKKELQKLEDALTPANPSGEGVTRWKPYIEKAFKELHVTATEGKIKKLLTQIQTESGGNPTISQQIWDQNMASGNPAQGLLQFVPSTFRQWAVKGHGQILNGYDQILAAINALEHGGEGGWSNVGIPGKGWANGGWTDKPSIFGEIEGEPELAINPSRQTADHYIVEAIRARAAKSPNGFAAKLNQMIVNQQQAGHQLAPATPSLMSTPTIDSSTNGSDSVVDLSGDVQITFQVDSAELARRTYPKYKMMKAQEIIIRNNGGAIPVGNAMPVGGAY